MFASNPFIKSHFNLNMFQVRKFLEIIYVRLVRSKFGWKKATQKMFNEKYIIQQMKEVMMINTRENLQLNDFSNSQTINPLTEKRTSS